MKKYPCVSASLMNIFVGYWQESGCDFESLNLIAGQDLQKYTEQSTPIATSINSRLFHQSSINLNDPAMGLKMSEAVALHSAGVLGEVILSADSLDDALQAIVRFFGLMTDSATVKIQYGIDSCRLELTAKQPEQTTHHQLECILGAIAFYIKKILADQCQQLVYSFPYSCQSNPRVYERVMGASCVFMQGGLNIEIPLCLMLQPSTLKDSEKHKQSTRSVQKQIQKKQKQETLKENVKQAISEQLRRNEPSQIEVAKSLGISVRNLQRKLKEAGASYQQLLDETRKEVAFEYIDDIDVPLYEIAFLVGYTEASAFYKAFRRWTGVTPGEYRLKLLDKGSQTA